MITEKFYAKFKEHDHSAYLFVLFLLLIIKTLLALWGISTGYIPLNPDEAQYWTWSQNLDFGYYSKPPGIALQIWLGCKFFGNTELGIRSMATLVSMLSSLAIYYGALKARFSPKICLWSALIFSLSPIGVMGTFAATTDGGFILFWILACSEILHALSRNEEINYYKCACFILCGSLFKWPIFILWLPIFVIALIQKRLHFKAFFSGACLSLCGLIPSLIWNSLHDWVTFRHAATQTTTTISKGNFLDFVGAQLGVLSPIFFVLLLLGILEILRQKKVIAKTYLFCALTTLMILGTFSALSLTKKIQANWALYAYPTATYVIAWYSLEVLKKGLRWLYYGLGLSCLIVFVFITIPVLQTKSLMPQKLIPYKINPFKHSVGWSELKTAFNGIDYDPQSDFLFSDSYQLTSLLSFYGPEKKRQYFFNTKQRRQNQFDIWPSLADEKIGKTGYYVWSKNSENFDHDARHEIDRVKKELKPYFEEITYVKKVPLFNAHDKIVKGALIFKCTGYNGKVPEKSKSY